MEIKRDQYVEKLFTHRWNGMVKVITGIRRCGKSYLLFNLFRNRLLSEGVDPSDIIEVKLEEMEAAPLRNPVALTVPCIARCSSRDILRQGLAHYLRL